MSGLALCIPDGRPRPQQLRDRIDAVDRQIIALFAERLRIVEDVAAAKLDAASPFRDREREDRLLRACASSRSRPGSTRTRSSGSIAW